MGTGNEVMEDNLTGKLERLVKGFRRHETWTKEKRDALEEIENYLLDQGYKGFRGHYSHYFLQRIGDSIVYKVPDDKRGHLAPYLGSWVRLMCIGQDSFYRFYLVGEINGERG
ncbi:hypothetical protein [Haliea sp.]